jgi:acyl-CoA ligase (AMP-forming) (exosortase A-associated)
MAEKLKRPPGEALVRPLDHLPACGCPDDTALRLGARRISYAELDELTGRWSAWLRRNAESGSRIASWTAKGEAACILPLACARAGMVHVPVNPVLKRTQLAHILEDSGASVLIANQARLSSLWEGDLPAACKPHDAADAASGVARCAADARSSADSQALAALFYTSGSTGRPKGVMLTHANLWLGADSVATYLGLESDDVTLCVLPLAFDYGQNQLLSTWRAGGCAIPLDYLLARDVALACARHRVTTLAGVPPLWWQLLEIEWPDAALDAMRRITNSGGALTPRLVTRLRARFPQAKLFAMYGLTEAFRSTYLDPSLIDTYPRSIGRAVPHAEIMVVDEDGSPTRAGLEGELVHCGPLVAKGYWRDPEATARRFRPAPALSRYGGTAVWSGDRVVQEEAGLLTFVGRQDGLIKISGNRVSPEEIEEAAMAGGLLTGAVAFGVPDERAGQAIVLVAESAKLPDEKGLRQQMGRILPPFMLPSRIMFAERLPRSPNGKFDRRAIAERFGNKA